MEKRDVVDYRFLTSIQSSILLQVSYKSHCQVNLNLEHGQVIFDIQHFDKMKKGRVEFNPAFLVL
jgi:hypothetical protein